MGPKRSESMRATNSVGRPIGEPDTNDSALISGCFTLENRDGGTWTRDPVSWRCRLA